MKLITRLTALGIAAAVSHAAPVPLIQQHDISARGAMVAKRDVEPLPIVDAVDTFLSAVPSNEDAQTQQKLIARAPVKGIEIKGLKDLLTGSNEAATELNNLEAHRQVQLHVKPAAASRWLDPTVYVSAQYDNLPIAYAHHTSLTDRTQPISIPYAQPVVAYPPNPVYANAPVAHMPTSYPPRNYSPPRGYSPPRQFPPAHEYLPSADSPPTSPPISPQNSPPNTHWLGRSPLQS